MRSQKEAREIHDKLLAIYPDVHCELNHKNAWQLLVATILSAQCTDKRVNMVTPALFKRFPKIEDIANCDIDELKSLIRSTGFYNNKAKNIKNAAKKIIIDFGGKVPSTMDELLQLPGVARKTANVILSYWFKKNEGVVVDTHVIRLSGRLGLSSEKNPVKIEKDLEKQFPQKDWGQIAELLVWHGRRVCLAKKPNCAACPLNKICPSAFKFD